MNKNYLERAALNAYGLRWRSLALVSIGLAALTFEANAAVVSFTLDAVVGQINGVGVCAGGGGGSQNIGTGSVPQVSCFGPTFSTTAVASADFGALKALADLRFQNFDFKPDTVSAFFVANAHAGYQDTLQFNKGFIWEFTVAVTGQSVFVNHGRAFNFNQGWCFDPLVNGCGGAGVRDFETHTFQLPIPSGGTIKITPTLDINLTADLRLDGGGSPPRGLPFTQDTLVDLSHTARFVSSRVLDANGLPLNDATIISESGFNYLNPPQPVPAPAAFVSLTLALAGLFARGGGRSNKAILG